MRKTVLLLLAMMLFPISISAQDTILSETNFSSVIGAGARALGMGGAFIAIADDATAASWNPAGLAQLERFSISLVSRFDNVRSLIPARGDSVSQFFMGAESIQSLSFGLDFASMTLPFRVGKVKIVPQLSYQRAVSFNLSSQQYGIQALIPDQDDKGRKFFFKGNFNKEDRFSGGFDMVSVSLGTRIFRRLNLGFSCNYWTNGYEGEKMKGASGVSYVNGSPDIPVFADHVVFESRIFSIKGINFNIGMLVEISDVLKLGAVYKTRFTADIDYHNKTQIIDFMVGPDKPYTHEASGRSELLWPRSFGFGLSYRPSDPLTVSLDYTNTEWSRGLLTNYHFEGETRDVFFPTLRILENEQMDNPQMDSEQVRLGMEYVVFGQTVLIPLRIGFFTDSQYYSDSSGRTVSMVGFTAGLGLKLKKVSFDLALTYENGSFLGERLSYSYNEYSELRVYLSTIFNL